MDFPDEHKEYVKVRADFMPDGRIIPLMFKTEDGQKTIIDRVVDIRPAPALKAGGQGVRYTCRIGENMIYLFHDRDYTEDGATLELDELRFSYSSVAEFEDRIWESCAQQAAEAQTVAFSA